MQTLFKSNLFSTSSSKMGAKNFLSGGKKLGSSIVGAAKNNIVNFARTAQAMIPQKKEEKENNFIKNYTNFFGSKKTEKILRKNLKLVRYSLVKTVEIAKLLKASIVSITKDLKGKGIGKGGGIFGSLLAGGLGGLLVAALPALAAIVAAGGLLAFGIALWKSPEFREATLNFIGNRARDIFNFLKDLIGNFVKSVLPPWLSDPVGFIRNIITGGDEFSKKHSELDQRLKDAGMNTIGKSLDRSRQDNRRGTSGRSPEQEKIFQEVEAERSKLDEAKNTMNKDMSDAQKNIDADRKPGEKRLIEEIKSLPPTSKERVAKEKELRLYQVKTRELKKEARKEIKADANKSVSSLPPSTDTTVNGTSVDAVKSDLNNVSFADSLKMTEGGSIFNLQPIPTTIGDATNKSGSGGDVTSTSNGGTSGGDAVTFYSSSNPDSSYHKLNALMTFNIV